MLWFATGAPSVILAAPATVSMTFDLRGCSSYFGNLDANTSVFLHWYKGVHIPILGCIRSSNIHDLESGGLPSSSPLYDISLAPLRQRIPLAIAAAHSGDDFR